MQRFKPKRRLKKRAILKLLIFLLLIFILLKTIKILTINFPNDKLLSLVINDKNYRFKETVDENIFSIVYNYAKENIINEPDNMITSPIFFTKDKASSNTSDLEENQEVTKQEISITNNKSPCLVYIYSSHQTEEYNNEYTEDYNINPGVVLASHILEEELNNIGINTIVMDEDITAYLNDNDLDYSYSYVASRYYLKQDIEKYPKVKLFIDLHRDAASKEVTTTTINDKKVAKVMFVIGKEYDTYQENLKVANAINDKINTLYPNLSRGVLQKEGAGVNGIYNQDLASNIILLELGGNENNLNEVVNTIELLVPIIGEYINET